MSTSGGYHDYIGGCSVHRGAIMMHVGDTMSTSQGYHEYIGRISWVHWGVFSTSGFSIEIERFLLTCSPTCIMISPRCTEHPPMYSWYPPPLPPPPPDVLNTLMYSWYPSMYSLYPPMYWTPPDVLNIPRCTEHTLYRVSIRVFCNKLWLWHPPNSPRSINLQAITIRTWCIRAWACPSLCMKNLSGLNYCKSLISKVELEIKCYFYIFALNF